MGVQVPELKQCVLQSFHFIVLSSSSLSSLLVLLLFREILLSLAPSKMRFGFAMTISLYFSSLPTKHHLTKQNALLIIIIIIF